MTAASWDVISHYYDLRTEHGRSRPRKTSRKRAELELEHAAAFLEWCRTAGVRDVAGYMRERFREMSYASRQKALPRLAQLKSDRLAARWSAWLEGEKAAAASYDARKTSADPYAQLIRTLAAKPHITKEAFKRRHLVQGAAEACESQPRHSGGYHPSSDWCQRCPSAAPCAAQLTAIYGFDVVALRRGLLSELPDAVLSALVR